jgi:voltage-gated potassium channel
MAEPNLRRERWKLVAQVARTLERPMLALSAIWIALLILEFTQGLPIALARLSDAIWVAFVLQFAVEFIVAPDKSTYLRKQWLTALSLVLPAFRLLRLTRLARVVRVSRGIRGVRLARVLGSMNRGMRALSLVFRRRGLGYVVVLTVLIAVTGAAGMYRFEQDAPADAGFATYGSALWWTAMLLTPMGSEAWPRTIEGRLLCLLLAVYAFAVFGYVTAAIAAYFVGQDRAAGTSG